MNPLHYAPILFLIVTVAVADPGATPSATISNGPLFDTDTSAAADVKTPEKPKAVKKDAKKKAKKLKSTAPTP